MGMFRGYFFGTKSEPESEEPVVERVPSRKEILRPVYKDNIEFGVYRPIKVAVGYVINENDDITFNRPERILSDTTNTRPIYSRKFYHKKWGSFYPFVPGNLSEIREVTSTSDFNEEYCVYGFLNEEDELVYYDHFAREN